MLIRKLLLYTLSGLAGGILLGLLIITLFFSESSSQRPVVELKQSARPAMEQSIPQGSAISYADAVDLAAPAVVNIHTTKVITRRIHPFFDDPAIRRFFGDSLLPPRQQRQNSLGSGVIVSEQGYVLTNNHVIAEADEILVALNDGRSAVAKIIGTDPETDLAVLKVQLDNLPSIIIGHSDKLRVGDVVLAIGNPLGVGQAVSQGIISATGRSQLGISTFENFIQTDAAINPGNSGGALTNAYGELVGINTAIFSRSGGSQGIGFAIPVDLATSVMKQIIEQGHAVRGWLGVEIQTLSPALAESFGLGETRGVVIAGVIRGGPADQAGLSAGDIITAIGKQEVMDANKALHAIAQTAPGTSVTLHGQRNNTPFSLEVIVSERTRQQQ